MKKLTLSSLFLVLVLALTACGPADTEPGEGTPAIGTPDVFETPADPMDTPVVPLTPETTPELTPEATEEVTPPATPEIPPTLSGETPVAGETPEDSPHRAINMLDYDVRNYEQETIGSVEELIVSLQGMPAQTDQQDTTYDQQQETPASPALAEGEGEHISYVIANIGGFLGIGQRQVAIPFQVLQLQAGEEENDYAFYIDISQEELEALPEVDFDQLDFTTMDWDLNLRTGWEARTGTTDQQTTPTLEDETPAPTETPTPAGTPDETVQAGRQIYGLRASVLLGSEVYDQAAVSADQTGETVQTPAAEETPAATDAQTTPTTGSAILNRETVVATVEDLIIDPDTGHVEYAVLEADDNLELGDRWIPVPLSALNILGADDLLLGMGIEYFVQVDRQQLAEAPNFEVGALPVVEDPNWDTGVRDYWGIQ
jgi:hypothetical protein